jgi:hypothetical protein
VEVSPFLLHPFLEENECKKQAKVAVANARTKSFGIKHKAFSPPPHFIPRAIGCIQPHAHALPEMLSFFLFFLFQNDFDNETTHSNSPATPDQTGQINAHLLGDSVSPKMQPIKIVAIGLGNPAQ